MTKSETICKQLTDEGCMEVKSSSKKYRKFSHSNLKRYIYIGKKGAIRYGETISDSIPLSLPVIQRHIYNERNKNDANK